MPQVTNNWKTIVYYGTFLPVPKLISIRLILKLAMINQMCIKQLDVKNAFLSGTITVDLYMKQQEGFNDGNRRVCQLVQSLYGLKQALMSGKKKWNLNKVNQINVFIF